MTPRPRGRTVLLAIGLVLAGVGFAAGLAVVTTKIASPRIGLSGTPGVLSPADVGTTSAEDDGPRPRTTTGSRSTPAATPTAAPTRTATPEPPDDDTADDDDGDDDSSGQGRGRGRGRGGDDSDDD